MIRDIEINLWLFCRWRGGGVRFSVRGMKWMSLAFIIMKIHIHQS